VEPDNEMLRGDWWNDGKEPYDDYFDKADRAADEFYTRAQPDTTQAQNTADHAAIARY
jgi:hypothetical protein